MPASRQPDTPPRALFWVTAVFLVIVAFTGGSSRFDVPALLVLRPVSMLACALALVTLRREHLTGREWLLAGILAVVAINILHLIPLPSGLWQALPGRQEIAQGDALAGLAGQWRPLTLTPINGLHSLVSLAVPLAVLMLACQLDRNDLFKLLPVAIAIGAASGFVGLLQAIGTHSPFLDPYGVGFDRGAGGLFANRNHGALMLAMLFPMLAAWIQVKSADPARYRVRAWAALAMVAVICPLILVTGSRSGLLLAGVGMTSAGLIVITSGVPGAIPNSRRRAVLIATAIIAGLLILGFATIYFARAEAIVRLLDRATINDPRFDSWPVSRALLTKYLPFGAGAGSFAEIYQVIEPRSQLNPQYWNHAHNDYLETGITFGLPGLFFIAWGLIANLRRAVPLWLGPRERDRAATIARMASVPIAMMALASLTDYPVRTPIMMSFLVLCCLWLIEQGRARGEASADHSPTGPQR